MFAQGHLIISKAPKFEVEYRILQNYVLIKHTPAYIWTHKVMWEDVLFNYYKEEETCDRCYLCSEDQSLSFRVVRPCRYRTRHVSNNSNPDEDIAMKFGGAHTHTRTHAHTSP